MDLSNEEYRHMPPEQLKEFDAPIAYESMRESINSKIAKRKVDSQNSSQDEMLQRFRPDDSEEEDVAKHWRDATPSEHGHVLWQLLEFADNVTRATGRWRRLEEITPELPTPIMDRVAGER